MRSLSIHALVVSMAVTAFAASAHAQVSGSASVSAGGTAPRASSSSVRLGLQGRLDALNLVGFDTNGLEPTVPIVTAGVRFVDQRLWLGAGLGFFNVEGAGNDGFSFSPVASFDLLRDDLAALSLVGWLTFGETDVLGGFGVPGGGDVFFWGTSIGVGVRGKISDGLAIGSEWGWGFLSLDPDDPPPPAPPNESRMVHGVFGTIVFEATVGL